MTDSQQTPLPTPTKRVLFHHNTKAKSAGTATSAKKGNAKLCIFVFKDL